MLLGLPIGFCFLSNLFLFCDEYKLTELFCCWQIVFSAIRRCVFGHINYFNLDIAHLVFFVTLVLFLHFINVKKIVVYTRVNGALHIENCKNYKKVIL